MAEGIFIEWQVLTAVGIPIIIALVAGIRYLWINQKCFLEIKNKIDQLTKSDSGSSDTHRDLYTKYDDVSNRLSKVEGKLGLICKHFKISLE